MKILILSDSNSPHTIRWAKSLIKKNCIISIFSLHTPDVSIYAHHKEINLHTINISRKKQFKKETDLYKLIYLKSLIELNRIIKEFKPDIVHAHYASSYGTIGALTGFHPFIISVWGTDIYNFPKHSFIHKAIIKYNLSRADRILSTSNVMKEEIKKYTKHEVLVTPFGIDINKFKPTRRVNPTFKADDIIIGTIKTLELKYGIEYLINAFYLVKQRLNNRSMKLMIVGRGSQEKSLKDLVKMLNINGDTLFTGYIDPDKVPEYHNILDIFVSVSIEDSESFGVAVLEASACEKPVVVSNVGGLPEVVECNITGIIVETKNSNALAEALIKLILNPGLRARMGKNGRERVIANYNWKESVERMVTIYKETLENNKSVWHE